jgi:4-hydroxy-4-methyl-2-oxoglutarate aldolase
MIEEPKPLTIKKKWKRPSKEQIKAFQNMPSGFVTDALDGQGALSINIKPVGDGRDINCVVVGAAVTAGNNAGDIMGTLAALNFIQEGDVLVASISGHQGNAAAGDRVMGMLKNCGGAGFVTDGPMRDYAGLIEVGLPAWCTGLTPASPFTKGPATVGLPINIAGQRVESGDIIVADKDGVVVVPNSKIDLVIERLSHIADLEYSLDAEVRKGLKIPDPVKEMILENNVNFVDD